MDQEVAVVVVLLVVVVVVMLQVALSRWVVEIVAAVLLSVAVLWEVAVAFS